jgi:cytochrome c
MFDTMTITKAVGALCGSLLVFLLGAWAAESLYHVGVEAHGEGEVPQAYTVAIEGAATEAAAPAAETVDVAALVASADADAGAKVFNKCKACHKIDGTNSTGPHLDGVYDRDIASVEGFKYSDVLLAMDGTWTAEHLNGFLTNPGVYAPKTKMSFAGLPKQEDRANLIAYLETLK